MFVDLFAPDNAVLADVRVRGGSFVDSDGDGASDADEAAAPNQGDGNGDGVPDVDQANVASLRDALTQSYVTIVSAAGTQLVVRTIDNRLQT